MSSPNDDGLQFAIGVLQKALVTKDDEIKKMKHANQVQLYVLLNEIAKRDEQNEELKDQIDSLEVSRQLNLQDLARCKNRIRNLENEVQKYRESQPIAKPALIGNQIEVSKQSLVARDKKDVRLLNHIQQTFGCHAAWDLADRCFKVKKGHNLPSILGSSQSKHFMDLGDWRLIKCVQCARFRTTKNNSSACLAMKFSVSNRAGFGIYLAYPIDNFDSKELAF